MLPVTREGHGAFRLNTFLLSLCAPSISQHGFRLGLIKHIHQDSSFVQVEWHYAKSFWGRWIAGGEENRVPFEKFRFNWTTRQLHVATPIFEVELDDQNKLDKPSLQRIHECFTADEWKQALGQARHLDLSAYFVAEKICNMFPSVSGPLT